MFVVKVGGAEGIDLDSFSRDLKNYVGKCVVVHGGSGETNRISELLDHPPKMVTSPSGYTSRFTDRETLEIFTMVYAGKVNKLLVEKLQAEGINAVGLSGIDGRIFEGTRKSSVRIVENGKKKVLHGDYTGRVEKVNSSLISLLMENGYIPVLTPPAISYDGEAMNVDGDRAAAMLASALGAEKLLLLSNVPGLLKNPEDEGSLIDTIPKAKIESFTEYAKGRMKKKILGTKEALDNGVKEVVIGDARSETPITDALNGKGTCIK